VAEGFCQRPPDGGVASARRGGTRTYRASGVDTAGRARAVSALLAAARYRAPASHGRPVTSPGHYAGLVRVGQETIAITTDTVGTKVLLAEQLGRWEDVGEDLVGVNVNDLAAVGARSVGLVDTILFGAASVPTFRAIGRGLRRGLTRARCSLLGGETAQVGEIVRGIDLGGTAIGYFPDGRPPVLGDRIRPGDVVLGLASSGLHANGFTLARRLLREERVRLDRPRPGGRLPLGRELLAPTRIYCEAVEALAGEPAVHGLAHLSGGGVRNLVRLHRGVRFDLDSFPEPPSLFAWLQMLGGIADAEMYQTFNMGFGFAVVASGSGEERIRRALARAGFPDARRLGRVARGTGVTVPSRGLRYDGYA
jgi:phosphoribosylformylglycinamidine cyclo-ligase